MKLCRSHVAALILIVPALAPGQALPAAPTFPGMPPVPTSLEDRRKALAAVLNDYWEDVLKHNPELASALGDSRYNDQVTNYTAAAYNDGIAREQGYLMQLAVIDQAGLTEAEKQQMNALEQRLEADQTAAADKPWQTPINGAGDFFAIYPRLAQVLPFTSAQDYDDWTARLRALPEAFAEAQQSMSLGADEGNVPAKALLNQSAAAASALSRQKSGDSLLAAPLKRFPASMGPQAQSDASEQMLRAVERDALPAYLRLARFLEVSYIGGADKPRAAATGPGGGGSRSEQMLLAVLQLRAKAEQAQGGKFDLKAFHDEVIGAGLLPMDEFRQRVDAWIGQ